MGNTSLNAVFSINEYPQLVKCLYLRFFIFAPISSSGLVVCGFVRNSRKLLYLARLTSSADTWSRECKRSTRNTSSTNALVF